MTSDRSRTLDRRQTPERETTLGKGNSRAHQSSPPSPPNCLMLETAPTTSRAASIRNLVLPVCSCPPEPQTGNDQAQTLTSRRNPVSRTHGDRTPRAEEIGDSEDEVAPSPNMSKVLTRLQKVASPGASSLSGELDASYKEKATPKKPPPSHLRKPLRVVRKIKK